MAERLAEQQQLLKTNKILDIKREEMKKKQEEEEKFNIEKVKKAAILEKRAKLQQEPLLSEKKILEVLFRLPNGAKISRRFRKSETIEVFYLSFSLKIMKKIDFFIKKKKSFFSC